MKLSTSAMNHILRFFACTSILCGPLSAQNDSVPATSNAGNEQFPRISKDLSVTFRLKAPEAKKVQVRGGAGLVKDAFDLTRGGDGARWVRITGRGQLSD